MSLIEIQLFLYQYAWELLVFFTSITIVCFGFAVWIDYKNEQITKNWKGALDANS